MPVVTIHQGMVDLWSAFDKNLTTAANTTTIPDIAARSFLVNTFVLAKAAGLQDDPRVQTIERNLGALPNLPPDDDAA